MCRIKFRHQWLYQEDRGHNLSGTLWIILHREARWSIFLKQTFQINLWKLGPSPKGRTLNDPPQEFPVGCPRCQYFMFLHACKRLKVRKNQKLSSMKLTQAPVMKNAHLCIVLLWRHFIKTLEFYVPLFTEVLGARMLLDSLHVQNEEYVK